MAEFDLVGVQQLAGSVFTLGMLVSRRLHQHPHPYAGSAWKRPHGPFELDQTVGVLGCGRFFLALSLPQNYLLNLNYL